MYRRYDIAAAFAAAWPRFQLLICDRMAQDMSIGGAYCACAANGASTAKANESAAMRMVLTEWFNMINLLDKLSVSGGVRKRFAGCRDLGAKCRSRALDKR